MIRFSETGEKKRLIGSGVSALAVWGAGLVGYVIQWSGELENFPAWGKIVVNVAVIVISFVVIHLVSFRLSHRAEAQEAERIKKDNVILSCYQKCDNYISEVSRTSDANTSFPSDTRDAILSRISPVDEIRHYIKSLFDILEAVYNDRRSGVEKRIRFDVAFLSRSLRDGFVTIVTSWDGKSDSKTLIQREREPKFYENTVAAHLYSEYDRGRPPEFTIYEDTINSNYHFFTDHQKEKLKSAMVMPLIASQKMVGTLVVHCDHAGFFRLSEKKYWEAVLTIFGLRITMLALLMVLLHSKENSYNPF